MKPDCHRIVDTIKVQEELVSRAFRRPFKAKINHFCGDYFHTFVPPFTNYPFLDNNFPKRNVSKYLRKYHICKLALQLLSLFVLSFTSQMRRLCDLCAQVK